MRQYELMLILDPDIDDESIEKVRARIKEVVSETGGEIGDEDHWGKRKLAYKIGKFTERNYLVAQLTMEPVTAKGLERTLNFSEEVMRHLLVLKAS